MTAQSYTIGMDQRQPLPSRFVLNPSRRTDETDETPVQAHSSPEIQRNTPAEALTKPTKPQPATIGAIRCNAR